MAKDRVRNSVKASIKDGVCWAAMSGLSEPYAIPYALHLGATPLYIGVLRSLPSFSASLLQIFNQKLVLCLGSCRKSVLVSVFAQSLSLFAASLCFFLPKPFSLYMFIALVVVYTVAGNMAAPPWYALMGEYIPPLKRGAFFGFRYQVVGVTFFSASFAASWFLESSGYSAGVQFGCLFFAAGIFRLMSFRYIYSMYEPKTLFHMPRAATAEIAAFFSAHSLRVRLMFLSVFMLLFGAYLAAPYFGVYVLQELKYGYYRYMAIMTAGPLVTYMLMRSWGRHADIHGSVSVLRIAFLLIPLVPVLWALNPGFYYLLAVEIYSGAMWAAYLIAINNFIYESSPGHARTGGNSFLAFVSGLAQFAGALSGGWLYENLPAIKGHHPFITLLIISGLFRMAALLPFSRLARTAGKEVRVSV